jgi:hypothetical protein
MLLEEKEADWNPETHSETPVKHDLQPLGQQGGLVIKPLPNLRTTYRFYQQETLSLLMID